MISLAVNGQHCQISADSDTPLLWVLRDHLNLRGTKYGCGVGICGICTVLVNGEPVRSCVVPISALADQEVETIEGIAEKDHPVVRAWINEQVPQCGYCQPGQIMSAIALLAGSPNPADSEIDAALSGILCRCGTYQRIRRAVHRVAEHSDTGPTPTAKPRNAAVGADRHFAPNPWIRIAPDNTVTVRIDRSEMGQGVVTALAMLVAEELEVGLDDIRTEFAPADPIYNNRILNEQTTGGSTSVRAAWIPLREAAATTRELFIHAAARQWRVDRHQCRAEHGSVLHVLSGRRVTYAGLIDAATNLSPPRSVELKPPSEFRVMGTRAPRLDIPDMVSGRVVYGMDIKLPGMLFASVARCPVFGGKVERIDDTVARQVKGVKHVVEIESGVAVVADSFMSAQEGLRELNVFWNEGRNKSLNNSNIHNRLAKAAQRSGDPIQEAGDVIRAFKEGEALEAVYETPYLAHATMEPMNCTAHVRGDGCDVWVGTQGQQGAQETAARLTGLPKRSVRIHTAYLGGGFGRRLEQDFVAEAVQISARVHAPVQVIWTRPDDMQHDFYRPANYTTLKGAFDRTGRPIAWFQRIVGPDLSLMNVDFPYSIPNTRIELVEENPGVPTGAWRSVGGSQNAFVIESFVDELAHRANTDPYEFRRTLLVKAPRYRAVLDLAAEKANWGGPLQPDRYQGIALYRSFGSWAAEVAEVSVTKDKAIKVHRVVCAIDCGLTVNPDTIVAQVEGAIAFGLSAALKEQITIDHGRVQQATFEDYPILTMAEMPAVEVHIMRNQNPPGGVGEPGVPPIAPAVANAVFTATGKRLRSLPLHL